MSAQSPAPTARRIVLADGECNVCNHYVNFILDRDRDFSSGIYFAALQSDVGRTLLKAHAIEYSLDTMVYIEDGRAYTKSDAFLRAISRLGYPWRFFFLLLLIPAFIRNFGYSLFAAVRYKLFGKTIKCRRMTPALGRRFLDYVPRVATTTVAPSPAGTTLESGGGPGSDTESPVGPTLAAG